MRARRLGRDRTPLVFGVGAAKSGTHSLAGIFGGYRAAHEPEADALCDLIVDLDTGRASRRDLRRYLRDKDERLALEVDASQLNGFIVDELVRAYPTAGFVLTVREPRAWLRSFYDHRMADAGPSPGWKRFIEHRAAAYPPHAPAERVLADHGLPPIAGRLRDWSERIRQVRDAVPPDRLLVVPTEALGSSIDGLARFAGVAPETLDASAAHAFAAGRRSGLLDEVDPRYVDEQIERWCAPHPEGLPGV